MARRKQGTEMPNAMTVLENGTSASFTDSSSRPSSSQKRINYFREGSCSSLEILPPEDLCKSAGDFMSPEDKDYRVGSAGRRPPSGRADSARTRRTPTPTKQISLQAARRREQGKEPEDFEEDWRRSIDEENRQIERHKERIREQTQETPTYAWGGDTKEIKKSGQNDRNDRRVNHHDDLRFREENSDSDSDEGITARGHKMHHRSDRSTGVVSEGVHGKTAKSNRNLPNQKVHKHKCDSASEAASGPASSSGTVPQMAAVHKAHKPRGAKQKKESESSSSEDEEDEDTKKAPNELLMELVNSLIAEDYENAQKLCQMVLMYEPDNQEALKFSPLIEEKLQLDAEESEDESDDDDDSDEDESGEDGDDDDEEDEDESGDDADSSPEDDEEEEGATGGKVENDDLDEGKWMELMMHMVMREFNQED